MCVAAGTVVAADRDRLLFLAESVDGTVIVAQQPDVAFNPASVVKVGTSLWALDRLGPHHRYATRFGCTGVWDRASGRVDGALVVHGGGDPDFQPENAFLVARELNRLGVRIISGDLLVAGTFWMGWENGVQHRITDPQTRALVMGGRLRQALDPGLWDSHTAASWRSLCARRGWDVGAPARVRVQGAVRHRGAAEARPLLVHRSNPLHILLKRFNTYSNNDLIRVAEELGGVAALETYLRSRLGVGPDELALTTASGEGRNRMTARVTVRLMRVFGDALESTGLAVEDVLPVPGCDPGPTRRMFPLLATGDLAQTVALKTGTLTTTDGGVAVLAGLFQSRDRGVVLFCVAAPGTGRELTRWRRLEQEWLGNLIGSSGGAEPFVCGAELPYSDAAAVVEAADSGGADG